MEFYSKNKELVYSFGGGDALRCSVVKPCGAALPLPREDFPKELYRI